MVALDKQVIIDTSENKLLDLCDIIFNSRDLSEVEETIWKASKIRLGLKALTQTSTETTVSDQQKILVTLNALSSIYNQQTIPQLLI